MRSLITSMPRTMPLIRLTGMLAIMACACWELVKRSSSCFKPSLSALVMARARASTASLPTTSTFTSAFTSASLAARYEGKHRENAKKTMENAARLLSPRRENVLFGIAKYLNAGETLALLILIYSQNRKNIETDTP